MKTLIIENLPEFLFHQIKYATKQEGDTIKLTYHQLRDIKKVVVE